MSLEPFRKGKTGPFTLQKVETLSRMLAGEVRTFQVWTVELDGETREFVAVRSLVAARELEGDPATFSVIREGEFLKTRFTITTT